MKRVFLLLVYLSFFIATDVKALGLLPAIITSNDSNESQVIGFLDGEYILPNFCSTTGCTIKFDVDSLMAIGKYENGSSKNYFYVSEGSGAMIYNENELVPSVYENNFNKIVIDADGFVNSGSITIKTGNLDESRTIKLIPYKTTTLEIEDSNIEEPDVPNLQQSSTESDAGNDIVDDHSNIIDTGDDQEQLFETENIVKNNKQSSKENNQMIIFILIGSAILSIIAAASLLSIRKKQFNV